MTRFGDWSDVYDSVYAYVRQDLPFYVGEAVASGGPVLELGCGTGRVAVAVAEAGVDVVGLDSSTEMLEQARRKAGSLPGGSGTLTLAHADMRCFELDRLFPLVIVPFRGFLSLLTVEDQTNTLLNVRRHLAPGGRLVFNVFVPDLDMLVQDGDVPRHLRDVTDPETGVSYVLWHLSDFDNYSQTISTRLIIEQLDDRGAVDRRIYRDFQLRYAHRWEMHHLLTSCGYEILDLYGDFDRTGFDEESTEMIWVAAAAA